MRSRESSNWDYWLLSYWLLFTEQDLIGPPWINRVSFVGNEGNATTTFQKYIWKKEETENHKAIVCIKAAMLTWYTIHYYPTAANIVHINRVTRTVLVSRGMQNMQRYCIVSYLHSRKPVWQVRARMQNCSLFSLSLRNLLTSAVG